MKNILIVGNGYIGSKISAFFQKNRLDYSEMRIFQISKMDYFNRKSFEYQLETAISSKKIDWIVNCVAFTGKNSIDDCEEDEFLTHYLNVEVPVMMAEVCLKLGVGMAHISSGCIYNGYEKKEEGYFSEEDSPNFGLNSSAGQYGKSKHLAENKLNGSGLKNLLILRIRLPFDEELNEYKNLLNKYKRYGKILDMPNSYTYLPDFFKALFALIGNDCGGTYNVTNPGVMFPSEICQYLACHPDYLQNRWVFSDDLEEFRFKVQRSNTILNSDKIQKILVIPTVQQRIVDCLLKR